MKFIVLDDFPFWTTYLLAVLVLCAFVFALTILVRSFLLSSGTSRVRLSRPRRIARPWFFVIAGAAAVWFLGSSMYLRFHAVSIDPERIELIYFWPRPPVVLNVNDLRSVKLARAHRTCGHMEVATEHELLLSVNFKKCERANEVLAQIPHSND